MRYVTILRLFSAAKRALQTLSTISANHNISRKCLHKLQEICGHCAILPSSYIISDGTARVGGGPITAGAFADVWDGTYRSKKVTIKCLKIPSDGGQTLSKVCVRYRMSLSCPLRNTCVACSHSSRRPLCGNG